MGSSYDIPKAIFYLLKGDYGVWGLGLPFLDSGFQIHAGDFEIMMFFGVPGIVGLVLNWGPK